MRVRFRLEAAEDVESARDWCDEQRAGLGDDFVASLEGTLELIIQFPNGFPEIAAGHRRALLHRFPYAIYYRLVPDVIDVVACMHNAQARDRWRSRQ